MPKETIRIGIDPDIDKSGVAMVIYTPFKKPVVSILKTMTFFELCRWIKRKHDGANEIGCLFNINIEAGWLNKKSNYHPAQSKEIAARIGKNVGENHAIGKLIKLFCEENNIEFILYKPDSSKWDAKKLRIITGYNGRTNQEMRDAVRAAWIIK